MTYRLPPTRTDSNQAEIMKTLRANGFKVWDAHRAQGGIPDLIVLSKSATPVFVFLEVKAAADTRGLRGQEVDFFRSTAGAPRHVVRSGEDAVATMKIYEDSTKVGYNMITQPVQMRTE